MGLLDKLFNRPPKSAMNLGRNEPCWCGNGKKYKKCHYDSILPPINDRSKLSEYLVAGFTKEFSHEATALG